ncbi:Pentatricopeptide repeat protein 91 [Zostera marina]|uniref:Pentatricopeptide repeat protein 91 n=1 Tax=Zostera marina TaxID=29655 RepID=A0A0K9P743_ZOSMR|nr:Pentatricopeptide repeat protein 91 [Zostera marina]
MQLPVKIVFLQTLHRNPSHLPCYTPLFQFITSESGGGGRIGIGTGNSDASLLRQTRQLHCQLLLRGFDAKLIPSFLLSRIIAAYSSLQDLNSATLLFSSIKISVADTIVFNALIRGHARFGSPETTLQLFRAMHVNNIHPDHFTFPFILKSCISLQSLDLGRSVHSLCLILGLHRDLYVGTSVMDMYVKLGEIRSGQYLFDSISMKDVSSWNVLIAGYLSIGSCERASDLFDKMTVRNVVSWTAMISGLAQNGMADRAISLFHAMEEQGVRPNWITIVSVLPACGQIASLEHGKKIHRHATSLTLDGIPAVQIALLSMYGRCGSLIDARRCFDRVTSEEGMDRRDLVVCYNTMIAAYGWNGRGVDVESCFEEMIGRGLEPDAVTFVSLLSGLTHSGLVEQGYRYFKRMRSFYHVEPSMEHYSCVVDLLGRCGRLEEAKAIIDGMPMEAGASVWGALLGGCSSERNLAIGEIAAERLFEMEAYNSGNYVLLSNMYAEVGRFERVEELRRKLRENEILKNPGCSWMEVKGKCYLFTSCSPSPFVCESTLEKMLKKMKEAGYVADTRLCLHDVSEEEKEHSVIRHSEKLALAFGIMKCESRDKLRVTKNLRICVDCHNFSKLISQVYDREIVIRDVNRFHHFSQGSCSCHDYW